MDPVLATIGIIAAIIGIGAGVIQIVDYIERKRQQNTTNHNKSQSPGTKTTTNKVLRSNNRIFTDKTSVLISNNLSSNRVASWMQAAEIDSLAVDDCVMILGSDNFQGWSSTEVNVSIEKTHVQIPPDLEEVIRQYKNQAMETKHDGLSVRVTSLTPWFKDSPSLHVTLSPVQFSAHFTISSFLDKAVIKTAKGTMITIRERYGAMALLYSTFEHPSIPTSVSIQIAVISNDSQLLVMRRSNHVAFYPNAWTISIEEGMQSDDTDFVEAALRGIREELGSSLKVNREHIKVLSFCVEYPTLSFDVVILAQIQNSIDEIKQSWRLTAPDKHELSQSHTVPVNLQELTRLFVDKRQWHPSARMRIIQILFSIYGVEETLASIEEARVNQGRKQKEDPLR